jgi:hypothetical protein
MNNNAEQFPTRNVQPLTNNNVTLNMRNSAKQLMNNNVLLFKNSNVVL